MMSDKELVTRASKAVDESEFSWRTVSGLAKELRARDEDVERVLENSGRFVRAKTPNVKGQALYTTKGRYQREMPFIQRLLGAAANTVSSNS